MFWHHEKGQKTGYEDSIVVGRSVRVPWSGWRKFYVIGCVVLVTAASIAGFMAWRANVGGAKARDKSEGTLRTEYLQAASQMDRERRYGEEVDTLKKYLATKPSGNDKYSVLIQLATTDINQKDYGDALKAYGQAKATGSGKSDLAVLVGSAMCEAQLGHNQAAISDYRQAIQQIESSKADAFVPDNGVDTYEAAIRQLGGTP